MMKKYPLVSIIMATYNRSIYISEAVDSIVNQSYGNWELLIIDDGGEDNTQEVLVPYLRNERIKYFKRTTPYKKGLPGSRNYGLAMAKGEFVIFYDDDDVVHPENIEICLSELINTNYAFCRYKIEAFVDSLNRGFEKTNSYERTTISIIDIEKIVTHVMQFNSCAVMWKKEFIGEKKFNEDLMYAEEWEFYTRLLTSGAEGVAISKVLYFARKHPNSNTGQFWNNNLKRRKSKNQAAKLVINTLEKKNLISPHLEKYFVRLGFFLKEPSIIEHILRASKAGKIKRMKYMLGYKIYPLLRPFFLLKSILQKL